MKTIRLFAIAAWLAAFCPVLALAQDWMLEKMPVDLETEFALSALPPRLREGATVYLLDPAKGYYVGRPGTNGFVTFVSRTEWERAEYRQDIFAAISFDPDGARSHMPVFLAVAEMRASGKYKPDEIRETIRKRVLDGIYQGPSRAGVSYMVSPLLRTYPDNQAREVTNIVMPHYMFYAPRIDNTDIGAVWDGHGPFVIDSGAILDKQHSIFNFIIIPAGDTERAAIIEANKDLLRKLEAYKSFLKVDPGKGMHH